MKAEYNISKTIAPDDWRGMRLTLDGREGETSKELMDRVAAEVDTWFADRYSVKTEGLKWEQTGLGPMIVQSENIDPKDTIAAIESCKDLKVLESYKLIAKLTPQYQEAYDTMYQKLSQ